MKNKVLELLQKTDEYISGEKMSNDLNISRTAVWKHIKNLRLDGYEIESVTNKGYKIMSSPDILNKECIKKGLLTDFIGKDIFIYDKIDSTNNEAKRNSQAKDGSVFICEKQELGKGRMGRQWDSPKGSGLWFTILLKPSLAPDKVSQITLVAGLAVAESIGENTKIKWPNDIIVDSKKVCGILTEMSAEIDLVNYIVCGIGINVNTKSFDNELKNKATSLYLETGKKYDRNKLLSKILNSFEKYYKMFLEGGFSSISDIYKSRCITLDKEVCVIYKNNTIKAKAVDISDDGGLIVEKDGERKFITSGEVSVRGLYGYI